MAERNERKKGNEGLEEEKKTKALNGCWRASSHEKSLLIIEGCTKKKMRKTKAKEKSIVGHFLQQQILC